MKKALLVLALAQGLVGCATLKPAVSVERFGTMDPLQSRALGEKALALEATPEDVQVVAGSLPKGLALSENNTTLAVGRGFEDRYEVVGAVEADFTQVAQSAVGRNVFWTFDYEETWRKALCYPQVPLKLLTLSMWNIVPLQYPCFASVPGDPLDRRAALIERLKRGGKALGANLVVVTASGAMHYVTGNKYGVSSGVVPEMSLKGFAVRVKDGAPPPKRETSASLNSI